MKLIKGLILLTLIIVFFYCQNNLLSINKIWFSSSRLPQSFDGYRIVHLSDLHCKEFGKNNWILSSVVRMLKPDIIIITGDLINANYFDENSILSFIITLKGVSPVFYVTGNHEMASKTFYLLQQKLTVLGITILRNSAVQIEKNGFSICLMGIDDPIVTNNKEKDFIHKYLTDGLNQIFERIDDSMFKILLSHRPEQFQLYTSYNIDLVFSGHAHGGLVRLPFIGGLIAPGQSIPPDFTAGMYTKKNTTMIVSRGLGNSSIPLRVFNRPEIILTTLHSKSN